MEVIEQASKLIKENTSFVLATIIEAEGSTPRKTSAKMIILENGQIYGTIGGGALEKKVVEESLISIKEKRSKLLEYSLNPNKKNELNMVCGGNAKIFLECYSSVPEIVLFGGGHVCQAIAQIADFIKIPYTIVDNMKEYANRERFRNAKNIIVTDFQDAIKDINFTKEHMIIIATRGHVHDNECVSEVLKQDVKYIGMIGSKTKVSKSKEKLKAMGFDKEKINQINMPIGLDIGAETPEEIAISIMAEVMMKIHNKTGRKLKGDTSS